MRQMKLSISAFCLFLFSLLFLVSYSYTNAESRVVADVNIQNHEILLQDDNKFYIKFDISNGDFVQPGIKYAVQLAETLPTGATVMLDETVYEETISLDRNESVNKVVEYEAPEFLSGQYSLWIFSRSLDNIPLGVANLGQINLDGSGEYIRIRSCAVQVDQDTSGYIYSINSGVDLSAEESLSASCTIENTTGVDQNLNMLFETYERSTFGNFLQEDELEESILVNEGINEDIRIPIPTYNTPQAYSAKLYLLDSSGRVVSNEIVFHYVIQGNSASIQTVSLDKDSYKAGDEAVVSVLWSGRADSFPNSRIGTQDLGDLSLNIGIWNSENRLCNQETEIMLGESNLFTALVPISTDCQDPEVRVVITDSEGLAIAEKNYVVKSKEFSVPKSSVVPLVYIVLLLVIILVLVLYIKYRSKEHKINTNE